MATLKHTGARGTRDESKLSHMSGNCFVVCKLVCFICGPLCVDMFLGLHVVVLELLVCCVCG